MPTGYTADLYDGKAVTVSDFILGCARAFGALAVMRDDPMDAPIPDEFPPSDYHAKQIKVAEDRLTQLEHMSVEEMGRSAQAEYAQQAARYGERRREAAERRERYEAMLAEVRRWQPPTAGHMGLRDFMVEQLERSIDFDCSTDYDGEPTLLPPGAWHVKEIKVAQHNLAYHQREDAKERERAAERTRWVRELRKSLPVHA